MSYKLSFRDSSLRYGYVTRWLHWLMALMFAWQFTSALARVFFEDSAFEQFMWGTHKSMGATLMLLVFLRLLWWALNAGNRPPPISIAARMGHLALYVVMFLVPFIGLVRQYGSGKAFTPWGVPLMPGFPEEKIEWMTDLGGNFHGLLGWLLLALIVGHTIAAFWHGKEGNKQFVQRMGGVA